MGTNNDVDYFYQHNDIHAKHIYGKVLPPRDWYPYIKDGGIGAGRKDEDRANGMPRLRLEYRWVDADLQAAGDDFMKEMEEAAAWPTYDHKTGYQSSQPSYAPSNTPSHLHHMVPGGVAAEYGQNPSAWDDDDHTVKNLKAGYSSFD